jgi:hypothetical protein
VIAPLPLTAHGSLPTVRGLNGFNGFNDFQQLPVLLEFCALSWNYYNPSRVLSDILEELISTICQQRPLFHYFTKKNEADAPLVLLKMNRLISRSALLCGSLYLGQHRRPSSPCTLCYKTKKGLSYQKSPHKVGSQRQTLCIENKARPIYLTLNNEDNLST